MSPIRNEVQSKWLKGLVANFGIFSQPPASVQRVSNMVMTQRGALITSDGTQLISSLAGGPQPGTAGIGQITEVFLYEPIGANNAYYAVVKDPSTTIGPPAGLAASDDGSGLLSAGVYQWVVTCIDGAGGESNHFNPVTLTLADSHKASLTWTAVTFATGYNLYRTIAGGSAFLLVNPTPITVASYVDNIPDSSLGTVLAPINNTTQVSRFIQLASPTYSFTGNQVVQLPADVLPIIDGTGGGRGGGGTGGGHSSGNPPTPAGGIVGNISPIPQIVQFANKMFLALGNGLTPYVSDGTTANTAAITNTFTAQYPDYANNVGFNVGDQITATVSGTAYIFQCVQAGISGMTGTPTWVATLNAKVLDTTGSAVVWQNVGQVTNSPAPRGAAHVEVFSGSLWVANTGVQLSSDQLDGPSAIRMSDANNPSSWNPLNAAQLSRDDGQQIQGIKSFSVADAGIPTTEQLVIFKDFSTYLITGVFGASDFAIQQAQTDMGCIAPRTINFVPGFGIARMTHLGIAVFDGLRDKIISEEIHPYIFPTNASGPDTDIKSIDWNYIWFSKSCQTANPPMYTTAVPLVPSQTPGTLAVTTIKPGVSQSSIPNGTYFVVLYMQDVQGNFYKSQEFGPMNLTPAAPSFNIILPATPSTALNYYILYGPEGAENQMITIPASKMALNGVYGTAGITSMLPYTSSGMLTRLLCFDLVLKAWTVIDLPFAISVLKQFRSIGTVPITGMAGFSDGGFRRWMSGDTNWDAGATAAGSPNTSVNWSTQPAEVYGEGASERIYFRNLVIRGTGVNPVITVTPVKNGLKQPAVTAIVTMLGANQFVAESFLGFTGGNFSCQLSGSGVIEIDTVSIQLVPKPVGAPVRVFS